MTKPKIMLSNIKCEYNGCSLNVKNTRTRCGRHKRHGRLITSSYIPYSHTIFINNIIHGQEEVCYQFENEVDLGIQELRKQQIQNQSLLCWKLPCNNRTKLSSTNKNRDHQLTPGERRIVRTCHQKKATIITYSSEKGQLLLPYLSEYFFMTMRITENIIDGIHSTDPRIEYVSIYSRNSDVVLSLATRLMSLCQEQPTSIQ